MIGKILITVSILVIFTYGCSEGASVPILETETNTSTSTTEPTHSPTFTRTIEASPTPLPTKTLSPSQTPTQIATTTPFTARPFQPFIPDKPLPKDVLSILGELPDGTLLLMTESQVIMLKGDTWEVYLPEFQGVVVGLDSFGNIWVINQEESRISSWDGTKWDHYTESDGWLSAGEDIWSKTQLVSDQSGQVWLVINNQLRVFDGVRWLQVSLANYEISHPLESDEGLLPSLRLTLLKGLNELWLGSCYWTGGGPIGGGGVLRYDGVSWHPVGEVFSSGCTEAIAEDHAGDVWIGLNGSLWHLDPQDNTWTELGPPPSPFGENSRFFGIPEITFDPQGNPWAEFLLCGGAGCGFGPILYRFENGTWVEIIREGFQYYRHVVFDNSGIPWLFMPAGIFNLAGNDLETKIDLQINPLSIFKDSTGRVWFLVEKNENPLWVLPTDSSSQEKSTTPTETSSDQCPPPGESIPLEIDDILAIDFQENINAYLNEGGSPSELQTILTNLKHAEFEPDNPENLKAMVLSMDLTGDTIPDILVSITIPYGNGYGGTTLSIYVCQAGGYLSHVLFTRQGAGSAAGGLYTGGGVKVFGTPSDLNFNGIPEIIFSVNWPNYAEYYIGEYSGDQYVSLIPKYLGPSLEWVNRFAINTVTDTFQIRENSGDNLVDIVITSRPDCSPMVGCLPKRLRTETWSWNGNAYYPVSIEHSRPIYRIQAAIDGDNATRSGDYEAATAFYQMAIFDENLKDDWPPENPFDRDLLAAYSRYRILLLHTFQGYLEAAATLYGSLVAKFPEGMVGHDYTALGEVFWGNYLENGDFESACNAAKEYAFLSNIRLDAPYSDGYYEIDEFSNYHPMDICSYTLEDFQ